MTEKEFVDRRYQELEALHRRRWGFWHWLVVGIILFIGIGLAVPAFNGSAKQTAMLRGSQNARQIAIALKSYAGDYSGSYPRGTTSNEVFRELIRKDRLEDESVFSCPRSPFIGDNEIGDAPDFPQALQPGENHWAMTRELTDSAAGNTPLVFENPAISSWPPKWDLRVQNQPLPGRSWKGGKIIVCRNDGSVYPESLEKKNDPLATLERNNQGMNLFEAAGPHEILDIAK